MNRIAGGTAMLLAAIGASTGCQVGGGGGGGGEPTPPGKSRIRFAAAADDLPAFDVCVDDELAVRDVRFGEITDYGEVDSGRADLVAIDAGTACDATAGAADRFILSSTRDYTLLVLFKEDPAVQLEDDNSPLQAGRARVRLINASPDSLALDVEDASGVTLLADVRYNEPDDFGYAEVVAGPYDLTVIPLAGDQTPFEVGQTELREGRVYTIFATGLVEPGVGDADLDVIVVEDASPGVAG